MNDWLEEVNKYTNGQTRKLIIGNKKDMTDQRVVSYGQGKEFAEKLGLPFLETSAKDSDNVNAAFMQLAETLMKDFDKQSKVVKENNTTKVGCI